ncbi:hypothetical protein RRG08_049571 [Elysia crispata]|uniref:Uncharacterized protein n=1 Tax=Elysia crispata TaxID=231223 RepID=A0AAE1AVJ8_9GAST|nr:hypothetical protein RRG08_049571 [Elysia crispata]
MILDGIPAKWAMGVSSGQAAWTWSSAAAGAGCVSSWAGLADVSSFHASARLIGAHGGTTSADTSFFALSICPRLAGACVGSRDKEIVDNCEQVNSAFRIKWEGNSRRMASRSINRSITANATKRLDTGDTRVMQRPGLRHHIKMLPDASIMSRFRAEFTSPEPAGWRDINERVVVNEPNPHEVEMIGGDQSDNPRSVLAFVFNYFSPYILIARTGELTLYDVGSTSTSGRSLLLWLAQDNSFSRVSLV